MPSTIIVDAMGGDNSPGIPVRSSLELCKEFSDLKIILVGYKPDIFDHISESIPDNLVIVNADDEIAMDDSPVSVFKGRKESSIHKGLEMLVNGQGDAFFSLGNTGAVVTIAYFKSGIVSSISRPALATIYPSVDSRKMIFLDLGATIDPKPENLLDFAIMGESYRYCITGLKDSRVGILNVGEEKTKGTKLVKEASSLISQMPLNYIGFIEGNHLFVDQKADVIVTDAFTGNIALKTIEGLNETFVYMIKSMIAPPKWEKTSSFVFNKIFPDALSKFQYNLYGSALLLGVNHLVGIGHGKSDATAFQNGILTLKDHIDNDFMKTFKSRIKYKKKSNEKI